MNNTSLDVTLNMRVLLVFSLLVLVAAWLGRYELVAASTQEDQVVYRLDRWTGNVHICRNWRCVKIRVVR
jgi:hypothetical protein